MKLERYERIAGVREDLPAGERVLWQGRPQWLALARRAFHVPGVGVYFALLALLAGILAQIDGKSLSAGLRPAAVGAGVCLLLTALAWLSSRTSIYAITSRRVFLRIGIALPITVNIPLRQIEAAALAEHADGSGDLALCVEAGAHLAYLHLWPHARPWRLRHPEPMLRSVAAASEVARVLSAALRTAHAEAAQLRMRPAATAPAQGMQSAGGAHSSTAAAPSDAALAAYS